MENSCSTKSEWAFYLLFTRAWELLAGSVCAWLMLNHSSISVHKSFKLFALATIFLVCSISINNEHPSIESVFVVIATMIILLGNKDWLPQNVLVRFIEKKGDWSYSVYLVHWPLFAFAYLSYVGYVPSHIKVLLIIFALFFGYLQFKYVETPFRVGKFKGVFSSWKTTLSVTVLLLAIPMTAAYTLSDFEDEFSRIRRVNHGISEECEGAINKNLALKQDCLVGKEPKLVIWGDSYAMHLAPGIAVKNEGVAQITKSVCGPIPDCRH